MALPQIETGYKPEFGLGALYQGFNAANADQSAQEEIIKQFLANQREQQMQPLDVQGKVFDNMVKDLAANQAQVQNTPENIGFFNQAKNAGYRDTIRKDELGALQHPNDIKNLPIEQNIKSQQLDTENQIAQIDKLLSSGGVDRFGAQATPDQIGQWQQERNKLVQQLASTPKYAQQLGLEQAKAENAFARQQTINEAKIAAAQVVADNKVVQNQGKHDLELEKLGYRRTPEGDHVYIPGGKADPEVIARNQTTKLDVKDIADRDAKFPKATAALNSTVAGMDKLQADILRLAKHPGLSGMTGTIYGRTPSATGDSKEAQALYDSIVARGGFNELQEMRNNSPTGGALGSVSDTENKYLRAAFAPIDRVQNTDTVRNALKDAANEITKSKQRLKEAYDLTYAYKGTKDKFEPTNSGTPQNKPTVSNW